MQLPPPLICVFSHSLRNIHRSAQTNLEWNESIQNQSYSKYTIEKFIRKKKKISHKHRILKYQHTTLIN